MMNVFDFSGRPSGTNAGRPKLKGQGVALGAALIWMSFLGIRCADPQPHPSELIDPDEFALTVRPADFGIEDGLLPAEAGSSIQAQPSRGRFPLGLAVAEVSVFTRSGADDDRTLRVLEMPAQRAAYWNQLLTELDVVREVKPIRPSSVHPGGCQATDILKAARREHCGLCLIYARLDDTEADAEFVAALWDADSPAPLAAFRAPVRLGEDMKEACQKCKGADKWFCVASFKAEADLRHAVGDAVWSLAARDEAAPTTQPSPWRDDDRLYPRDMDRLNDLERRLRDMRIR